MNSTYLISGGAALKRCDQGIVFSRGLGRWGWTRPLVASAGFGKGTGALVPLNRW